MPGEEGHLVSTDPVPDIEAREPDPVFEPLDSEPLVPEVEPEPVSVAGSPTQIPVTYGHDHTAAENGFSDRTADIVASQTESDTEQPEAPVAPLAQINTTLPNEPVAPQAEKDTEDIDVPAALAADADKIAADMELEHRQEAGGEPEKAAPEDLSQSEQAKILEYIASLLREHKVSPAYRNAHLAISEDISTSEGLVALGLKAHKAVLAFDRLKFENPKVALDTLKVATSCIQVLVDIQSGVASDPGYELPKEPTVPLQMAA